MRFYWRTTKNYFGTNGSCRELKFVLVMDTERYAVGTIYRYNDTTFKTFILVKNAKLLGSHEYLTQDAEWGYKELESK